MRYVMLTTLACILLVSMGCKDKSGSSNASQQNGDTLTSTPKDGIIGTWEDYSNPILSSTITIYAENGKLYFENKYNDESSRKLEIVEKKSDLGRRFDPVQSFQLGDHWVIDSNGDLLMRDNNGTAYIEKKSE